jgi:hypothetical protein
MVTFISVFFWVTTGKHLPFWTPRKKPVPCGRDAGVSRKWARKSVHIQLGGFFASEREDRHGPDGLPLLSSSS